jgi:hypothetical protein
MLAVDALTLQRLTWEQTRRGSEISGPAVPHALHILFYGLSVVKRLACTASSAVVCGRAASVR